MNKRFERDFVSLLLEAESHPFGQARRYLRYEKLSAYIRIGRRALPDRPPMSCVQLANLDIPRDDDQRDGTFTRMLAHIMSISDMPIYLENVLNTAFGDAMLRRGFTVIFSDGVSRSMVLYRTDMQFSYRYGTSVIDDTRYAIIALDNVILRVRQITPNPVVWQAGQDLSDQMMAIIAAAQYDDDSV